MPEDSGERRRAEDARYENLDRRISEIASRLEELARTIRQDIAQLQFVRQDVFAVKELALEAKILEARDEASQAKAISMWALGLIVSGVIGAILIAVVSALG